MAKADFDPRVVPLPHQVRLTRVDIHDQGFPKTVGISEGIAERRDDSIHAVTLHSLCLPENGIAGIEVSPKAANGARQNAGHLRIDAS